MSTRALQAQSAVWSSRPAKGLAVFVAVLLATCSDGKTPAQPPDPDPRPTSAWAVAGDGQRSLVGTTLSEALVVEVRCERQRPLAGVAVHWVVMSGGGSVSASMVPTDAQGRSSVHWTLGPEAGTQLVAASAADLPPLAFRATAKVSAEEGLILVEGDGQRTRPLETLPLALETLVRDSLGRPLAGVTVRYQGIGTGSWLGGSGWPPVSDADGGVKVRWNAPDRWGPYEVSARVEGRDDISPATAVFQLTVSSFDLDPGRVEVARGDSARVNALLDGQPVTAGEWVSGDSTIARVDTTGWVHGISVGTTSIIARYGADSAVAEVRVWEPPGEGALRYFDSRDFVDGELTVTLAPSPSGITYLFAVGDMSSVDWRKNEVAEPTTLEVFVNLAVGSGEPSDGRSVPQPDRRPPDVWSSPEKGAPTPLQEERQFWVYSRLTNSYVGAVGRLTHEGRHYVFYADTLNQADFTGAEYAALDSVLSGAYPRLTALMGEPTDLDGNDRVVVFISRTVSAERPGAGEAYVDGCNLAQTLGPCMDRGEIVYFVSLEHFGSSKSRGDLVLDYYPRNILHESIHILQHGHKYRRGTPERSFSAPAFYYEGQAEVMRQETGLGLGETWNNVRQKLVDRRSMFSDPYFLGAVWHWFLSGWFGDQVHQGIIEGMYGAGAEGSDVLDVGLDVREPLGVALFYAGLQFDGTSLGAETGLEFPRHDVLARLGGRPPVTEVEPGSSASLSLGYTAGAALLVRHTEPVVIALTADPRPLVLLVVGP